MLPLILAIVVTIASAAFLYWYCDRTPDNLESWYGTPVIIAVIALVVVVWVLQIV